MATRTSTPQQWQACQDRYQRITARLDAFCDALKGKYGLASWLHWQSRAERKQYDALCKQQMRAADACMDWLDRYAAPRNWHAGVPMDWLCRTLSYADAITLGQMATIPPPAYGYSYRDAYAFAQSVSEQ